MPNQQQFTNIISDVRRRDLLQLFHARLLQELKDGGGGVAETEVESRRLEGAGERTYLI